MYLVVSVFPSSTTSGARPPARAASSFVRCSPQVWISTFTLTSACELSNERFAALTTAAQSGPCASVISQTVSVVAFAPTAGARTDGDDIAKVHSRPPATSAGDMVAGPLAEWFVPMGHGGSMARSPRPCQDHLVNFRSGSGEKPCPMPENGTDQPTQRARVTFWSPWGW